MSTELVERAQHGDHGAFDILASRGYQRSYAIAYRILRDPYAAEDAVQEALIRAWRDLRGLREASRFEAWLHRLVVRACVDVARKRRRRPAEVALLELDRPEPTDETARVADRDVIERAFLDLSPEHRAVLVLVHYAGHSAPEAAEILGVPPGTVYSRLHHASRRMRQILGHPALSAASPEQVK